MFLLFLPFGLLAQEESDFLALLNESSELATKTQLNVDETPSVITVIRGDELRLLGFSTLFEALAILPGIEPTMRQQGWQFPIIRGIHNPNSHAFDKLKLMIDGVAVNNALYGTIYYYMNFPVDLIEQIEVLRGPGSALYGTGAYSGVVNVITKSGGLGFENGIYAGAGSGKAYQGGAFGKSLFGEWTVGGDLYYQTQDRRIDIYAHRNYAGSEGESIEKFTDKGVGVVATNGAFTLRSRLKRSRSGNYFGFSELPESDDDKGQDNRFDFLEAEYKKEFDDGKTLKIKTGYSYYDFDMDVRGMPARFFAEDLLDEVEDVLTDAGVTGSTLSTYLSYFGSYINQNATEDYIYGVTTKEKGYYTHVSFDGQAGNHNFLVGGEWNYVKNLESGWFNNYPLAAIEADLLDELASPDGVSTFDWTDTLIYSDDEGFVKEGVERINRALYLQDQWDGGGKLSVTAGIRGDHYSDIDKSEYSYRLGLVHKTTENLSLKLLYGRSHRAPSFVELYLVPRTGMADGNEDLDPETADTYEAALVYTLSPSTTFRLNGYIIHMQNVIDYANDAHYDVNETYWNYSRRKTRGYEAEFRSRLTENQTVMLSYAATFPYGDGYQPYFPDDDGSPVADVANHMGKAYHLWHVFPWLSNGLMVQFYGPRTQSIEKKTLPAYTVINETLSFRFFEQSRLDFIIKNLLDEDIRYPSGWGFHEQGLPREGRTYLVKYTMNF